MFKIQLYVYDLQADGKVKVEYILMGYEDYNDTMHHAYNDVL